MALVPYKASRGAVVPYVKASKMTKKTYNKSKKTYKKSKIAPNIFGGNSKVVKMEFVSDFYLTSDASPTINSFSGQVSHRLNNVNIPYVGQASGMSLPQGYTSAATAYRSFKVLGAKVEAEFYDPSDDCQVGALVTSSGDVTTLQGLSVNNADMLKYCIVKPVSSDGGRKVYYKRYWKIAGVEGNTAGFNNDIGFYSFLFNNSVASAATDEAGTTGELIKKKVPKLHLAVAPNVTTQCSIKCKLRIIYYVKVFGKLTLATSTSAA